MNIKIKLKKGDEVVVLAGKDKGKKGKIIKILPKKNKAIVSDINKSKKNQKPDNNQPGGIIDKEMPIHISNLSFFDSVSNKGVRIGYKVVKEAMDGGRLFDYFNKKYIVDDHFHSDDSYIVKREPSGKDQYVIFDFFGFSI